ncbi:ChaN family lipoprotein [Methylonatrum kenyense]|uniref:ChaN family lipoprotein n=1 Tax=Methylonatrum kenyense TaxID=455253 RepID=UPI0020BDB597|nr:ChaN family lipoprotein [Methylonatrum kenyense]MCK8516055.1 ChaN family lipoprotein [Methylonatrum kenyense]
MTMQCSVHPARPLLLCLLLVVFPAWTGTEGVCPDPGTWAVAGENGQFSTSDLLDRYHSAQVILLGETHDRIQDHRWQLHLLAALHGRHPEMSIGFEMLPRRSQASLDAWIRGELDEEELLKESNWFEVWGHASSLYMPLFQFARMHRIPSYALNVDRDTVSRIGRSGWEALPDDEREHVGPAAEPPADYVDEMREVLASHPLPDDAEPEDFLDQFVRSQTVWDRAMAEKLAEATKRHDGPAIGIVGRGHAEYGHGIPHQLEDLGIDQVVVLLPHRQGQACLAESPYPADALFGIATGSHDGRVSPPRLGASVSAEAEGLLVTEVSSDGPADRAGLRADDILVKAGGRTLASRDDLLALLDQQRPGSALAMEILRNGQPRDLLVEF